MNKTRVGQQVGPYRLTRLLGAGGFGEVYEAEHQLLQQKRVIKLLLERHFHTHDQRERFLREARTLATLEHSNILPLLEAGEEDTMLYLVMPFYRRGTLGDLLKQRATPLSLAEVERFLAQMCTAVGYAHAQNIAHLDLKPDNMLLHEDGRLVLSDFGLAHLIKQGRLEAGSSARWGTPHYMAPEHIRGKPEPRSDLYALGIILYQLLTNQRPFTGSTPEAVMMKHLLETPPPLRAASSTAPATLESVMQKALKKEPEERYATAEALLADFRAATSSILPRTVQPPSLGAPPSPPTPHPHRCAPVEQPTISVPPDHVSRAAEPANVTNATAVCEIKRKDGHHCRRSPTDRCVYCERAICVSHQAGPFTYTTTRSGGSITDLQVMCTSCAEAKNAALEEYDATWNYFVSGAARTALVTAGVPPVAIHWVEKRWKPKKGLFGQGGRDVEMVIRERGWILGEFEWAYNRGIRETVEDCLTALLDISPEDRRYPGGLARVRQVSEGYEALDPQYSTFAPSDHHVQVMLGDAGSAHVIKAAQVVRQLAGLPS